MKKYTANSKGVYSTMVWDGTYDAAGRKHRKQIRSLKSSADLERKVAEFKAQVENKTHYTKTLYNFVDYANYWLHNYKVNIRHNTKVMYENVIEKHFDVLEPVNLYDLKRVHLKMVLDDKQPAIARQIYMTFKQVVKCAIREHYLPFSALEDIFADNPPPKPIKAEKRALNDSETKAILNTTLKDMEKMYLWIAYGCGLRREEILALEYKDINQAKKTIIINKVIVYDKNNPILEKNTKSINSRREVPVPDFMWQELKDYASQNKILFFKNGKYLTQTVYTKMWQRIKKNIDDAVGYDTRLTSHSLRHNYCSQLCYQVPTISIKKVAQLLGDSVKVVTEVYDHIIEDREKTTLAINSALGTRQE